MLEAIDYLKVIVIPLLLAITLHEAAHAYAAKRLGDLTAYAEGRMTLNPFKHIDPFGTIALPLLIYFTSGGSFLFGFAKPVPVNFNYLRNPKRDMAWVAAAGPGANFVMAFLWGILLVVYATLGVGNDFLRNMAQYGIQINLILLALNLLPIPPLDGGRIVTSFLPNRYAYDFSRIEPYGIFIVIGLMLLGVLRLWIEPVMEIADILRAALSYPFLLFLS
jgi:Zn-dependent protease